MSKKKKQNTEQSLNMNKQKNETKHRANILILTIIVNHNTRTGQSACLSVCCLSLSLSHSLYLFQSISSVCLTLLFSSPPLSLFNCLFVYLSRALPVILSLSPSFSPSILHFLLARNALTYHHDKMFGSNDIWQFHCVKI